MDPITTRLVACFQTVFPALSEGQARQASPASVAAWDSVAAITLVNVLEEEFGIEIDFELLPELTSFDRFEQYLRKETTRA
ncbi:MAG TPA: acyl carrier protein [Armatimonadota bacterium]|jgi:acyl carrier protein